jgi:hypothetical protein
MKSHLHSANKNLFSFLSTISMILTLLSEGSDPSLGQRMRAKLLFSFESYCHFLSQERHYLKCPWRTKIGELWQ